ncbi:MAG: hypothetical protein AB1671_22425 [Thermodesulfobacteriota bacterium]|jgi:hypothetical protein
MATRENGKRTVDSFSQGEHTPGAVSAATSTYRPASVSVLADRAGDREPAILPRLWSE